MSKYALVTGANRGLGFEISRQLLQKGFHLIVTSRGEEAGKKAANELAHSVRDPTRVSYYQMDVTNREQIQHVKQMIERSLTSELDLIVNNAGIMVKDRPQTDESVIRDTINTNFKGPVHVSRVFSNMLSDDARVVNLSARVAQLQKNPYLKLIPEFDSDLKKLFQQPLDQVTMTGEQLENLMDSVTDQLIDGTLTREELVKKIPKAFPNSCYLVSKLGLNAYTKVLAAQLKDSGIIVNACCPGWVKTDLGGPSAPLTVEKGAATAVYLSTAPKEQIGVSGELFGESKVIGYL